MARVVAWILFSIGLLTGCGPALFHEARMAAPTVFVFPPTWTLTSTATPPPASTLVFPDTTPTTSKAAAPSRTSGPLTLSRGNIAFSSRRSGQSDIYVMNPDGTNVKRITESKDYEDYPAWSPDGKQLAFVSWTKEGGSSFEIAKAFVINADGTGRRLLIKGPGFELFPNWSPDGERIIFAAGSQIAVMRSDGSKRETILTDRSNNLHSPKWSPDGSSIVFSTQTLGIVAKALNAPIEMNIFVLGNHDGSKRLLNRGEMPAWSSDGSRIAFCQTDQAGTDQVFVINADGSGVTQLTKGPEGNIAPDWSPDGSRIVFTSWRDGNPEIYVMNADGTNPTRLTNHTANDMYPTWSR